MVTTNRKSLNLRIENTGVRMQLNTASDITIINEKIWEQIGKPTSCCPNKIAYGVIGRKLDFNGKRVCNIMFKVQNERVNVCVLKHP